MAIVFGIEGVPVFEVLTVVSVLLLICLIIVLIELRKLSSLIRKEKSDLGRFEKDISEFESTPTTKFSNKLEEYVHNAVVRGMSKSEIEDSLSKRGWSKAEVDEAFKKVGKEI